MAPNDPTLTHTPQEPEDSSAAAWDAGMAAAFGPSETGSHHPVADPEAGVTLAGKYRLSERIGEGGMGSVWVAQQSEPVKRKVAVKLIKAGMDSKSVLARFEAERQALAVMDHPNIAKVLDGGLHDGRPFFVMELVKGVPITEYCDAHKLTPRQRLELFVPVCQAIQHAHQKGIIHRDIKPSNVLIAQYDDKPVPKVIDFGIAKATGGTLTEQTIETAFGGVVGTPQYMSPEQASLNNLDIDTRSDVYSLGVLLYELLTGSPPFSPKELEKKGLLEILRVVREEEPPRPSTKLSTADALPSLSANRGTEPTKLTGLLRNELDWIVMKALEKDRARRYETANGFAADVLRYLSGEAVQAHPPSTAYRLKKFVRRHKGQVIAASLVLLALLAGIVGTSWGFYREAQRAEGERLAKQAAVAAAEAERQAKEIAQASEAETAAVLKFVEEKVFAAARPAGQAGGLSREVTLRRAIESALPWVDKGFENQPLIEARLRTTIGYSFWYLGEPAIAADQHRRSLELRKAKLGADHPHTLVSVYDLANSYAALGRHQEALALNEETLKLQKAKLGADHSHTLASMRNLAMNYAALGRHPEALALNEETLKLQKSKFGADHPETLRSMNNLSNCYAALGRHPEALALNKETVMLQKANLGADHPETLASMSNLATSYAALGRHPEALAIFEETLKLRKANLGADHPDTLTSMSNLATSYAELGRHPEALALREETLKLRKAKLGADHPRTLASMHNLAVSYSDLGRRPEAMALFEETLRLRKAKLGADHPHTLMSMAALAMSYADLGRHPEALAIHEETLKLRKAKLGERHPDTITTIFGIACCHALMAVQSEKTPRTDAARLAEADLAMDWLKQAFAAGYRNLKSLKEDKVLDILRDREDFKKLLAELEAKAEKK